MSIRETTETVPSSTSGGQGRFCLWLVRRCRQLRSWRWCSRVWLVGACGVMVRRATSLIGLPDVGDPFDIAAFRSFTVPDDRNAPRHVPAGHGQIPPNGQPERGRPTSRSDDRIGPRLIPRFTSGSRAIARRLGHFLGGQLVGQTRRQRRWGDSRAGSASRTLVSVASCGWRCLTPRDSKSKATCRRPGTAIVQSGHRGAS